MKPHATSAISPEELANAEESLRGYFALRLESNVRFSLDVAPALGEHVSPSLYLRFTGALTAEQAEKTLADVTHALESHPLLAGQITSTGLCTDQPTATFCTAMVGKHLSDARCHVLVQQLGRSNPDSFIARPQYLGQAAAPEPVKGASHGTFAQ